MLRLPFRSSIFRTSVGLLLTSSLLNLTNMAGLSLSPASARNLVALSGSGKAVNTEEKNKAVKFGGHGSGELLAMAQGKQLGQCALKHTDVQADISGYIARVTVKQTFTNPFKYKIEAVYTFPLSDSGAVDEMFMKIGARTIHGTIKKREEARQIYEAAKANGQVAALLDQERTNIFTQAVANIEPGKDIEITIKYIETLPYESGKYTFAFPTVVGPRFNPGNAVSGGPAGTGRSPNTDRVPDASKITPPIAPERAGHDISIAVKLLAGMPVSQISSKLHEVAVKQSGNQEAEISLVDKNTIPNKDFVLSWDVAENNIKSGYLTYKDKDSKSGYFTLMLVPPKRVTKETVAPKEMIFVIDCSGSQSGPPLQKAKETMLYILDHMNDNDTFQIITFNNNVETFADKPQISSPEMKTRAKAFINALQANGGTWMAPAVEKACATPADSHRLRIVTFMTDGYVGNDMEILGMVRKLRGQSRWFPFGTGNGVNRALIDGMAEHGGGEAEYVLLNSSANEVGKKFYDRIAEPVLTDVALQFSGVEVKDVLPKEVSDVWAERPLYFKGRYLNPGAGTVTLTGYAGGKPYKQTLAVNFPKENTANPGIPSLWARAKVDRLMAEDFFGAQQGTMNKELKDEIVQTALTHHIMTQYTSFVAVDDAKTKGGQARQVAVPVELPDGVDRRAVSADSLSRSQAFGSLQGATNGTFAPMVTNARHGGGRANVAAKLKAYPMACPVPPSPVGQSGGAGAPAEPFNRPAAGGGGFYHAARQLQIAEQSSQVSYKAGGKPQSKTEVDKTVNEKKSELKEREHEKEPGKDAGMTAVTSSKLAGEVSDLLSGKTVKAVRKGDKVLLTVKVTEISKAALAKLKALGITLVSKDEKTLTIEVYANKKTIRKLAEQDFVLKISLSSDPK